MQSSRALQDHSTRMWAKHLILVLVVLPASGCTVLSSLRENLFVAPRQYPVWIEQRREKRRNEQLASEAWDQFCSCRGGMMCSPDYERGFKEGYADFLFSGCGAPPAMPPRGYWRACYQTPEGYRAISDWYVGFRDGSAAAHDGPHAAYMRLPTPYALNQAGPPITAESIAAEPVFAPSMSPPPQPWTGGWSAPQPYVPQPSQPIPVRPLPNAEQLLPNIEPLPKPSLFSPQAKMPATPGRWR